MFDLKQKCTVKILPLLLLIPYILLGACDSSIKVNGKKQVRDENGSEGSMESISVPIGERVDIGLGFAGDVSSCEALDELPKGLVINKDCFLQGLVTRAFKSFKLRVMLKQEEDVSTNTILLTPVYNFYKLLDIELKVNVPENIAVLKYHAPNLECDVNPALPKGFKVDPNRGCEIQGTYHDFLEKSFYEITINDDLGNQSSRVFSLKVTPYSPKLQGKVDQYFCQASVDEQEINFKNVGEEIENCVVEPELPLGLFLNKETCTIKGKVSEEFQQQNYKIIANSKSGSYVKNILLSSVDCERPVLAVSENPERFYFYQHFNRAKLNFKNLSGVKIKECEVSPRLPEGLFLDSLSCSVSGKPVETIPLTQFEFTANGENGKSSSYLIDLIVKNDFISKWEVNEDESGKNILSIPLHLRGSYNFDIDWGDGSKESYEVHPLDKMESQVIKFFSHDYDEPGLYTIAIQGEFSGIRRSSQLRDVEQFGSFRMKNPEIVKIDESYKLFGTFQGLTNFKFSALDEIDLYNVKSLRAMFQNSKNFNSHFLMDTSYVEDMSYMFNLAESFNQILQFNTSNVVTMEGMFAHASSFNQPLNFDTSKTRNMENMLTSMIDFNRNINFNTQNVRSMKGMFSGMDSFDSEINFSDTSNVIDMSEMFSGTLIFNKELHFDTSGVEDMSKMFYLAELFNQPINFKTSNVLNMEAMFKEAYSFNMFLQIDTSNVVNMTSMFESAKAFNKTLTFDTSKVQLMDNMFKDADSYNQEITLNTSNVTSMSGMFSKMDIFDKKINLNTSNVTSMSGMFSGMGKFNRPINFDTSKVKYMSHMFSSTKLFNQSLNFNTSKVEKMVGMFQDSKSYNSQLFLDTRNVIDMSQMFAGTGVFNQELNFETPKLKTMNRMFSESVAFDKEITFDTSRVNMMRGLFFEAKSYNQPINFKLSDSVSFLSIFEDTEEFDQDISHFPIENVNSWHLENIIANAKGFSPANTDKLIKVIYNKKDVIYPTKIKLPPMGRTSETDDEVAFLTELGWTFKDFPYE